MSLLDLAKAKATTSKSSSNNHSGMGFLLVFFPQDNNTKLNFPSPNSKSPTSTLKRTNPNNLILSKAQFTISICALLLFFTLLLFTLSTFEPTISNITPTPRRLLLHKPPTPLKTHNNWLYPNKALTTSHALQRMGTLYRRGTRSMTDLIICHVADETALHDFRLFFRLIHRSGITAKTDVVFLFSSPSASATFAPIIHHENNAFSSLVSLHAELTKSESSFNLTRFYDEKSEMVEPLWGKRIRSNVSEVEEREGELAGMNGGGGELLLSYGSVLSFDATELDPESLLAGFMDRVPLSLRRWACYPMLLGRVRRNFKHVMLVDVKNTLILKEPLERVRNRTPESVFLFSEKNSDKTRSTQRRVNSGVIIGGARGVRRLCNAVLVEIVRAAMQHSKKNSVSDSVILSRLVGNEFMWKSNNNVMLVEIVRAAMQHSKKNSVSDSVILSRLVGNEFMWKSNNNVNFVTSTESIPEASSLVGRNSGTATSLFNHAVIKRGAGNYDISSVINKEICSSVVDSSVYRDC